MSRPRIGGLVLLALLLLFVCFRATSNGEYARSVGDPAPTVVEGPTVGPSTAGPTPPPPGLYVRTCGDGSVGLLEMGGEAGDSTGVITPVDGACEATDVPGVCAFHGVAPGRYRLRHEGFSAVAEVGFDGWGSAQFSCDRSCLHRFNVRAHGCATGGFIRLSSLQPDGYSSELAQAEWTAERSTSIEGVPCGGLAAEISGGTCAPVVLPLESSGLLTAHAIDLVPAHVLHVRVTDATTKAPISGARVITTAWFRPAVTGADGAATVVLGAYRFQAAIVLATGYAGHDLMWDDIPWDGHDKATIEVPLQATEPLQVVCDDEGAPCAPETRIRVYSVEHRERMCAKAADSGVWTCPSTPGDLADARLGTRRTRPSRVIEGETELLLRLPPAERSICFSLAEGETCRAVVSNGTAWSSQIVKSGVTIAVGPVSGEPIVALRCRESSWYDVLAEEDSEACIKPDLEPLGSICVDMGRSCTLLAKEPRWDTTKRRLSPCVDEVPAGVYELACYGAPPREVTAIAGETVTIVASDEP